MPIARKWILGFTGFCFVVQDSKVSNLFKIIFVILLFLEMLCIAPVSLAEDQNHNWSSRYNLFRGHFKSLPQSEVVYCERLLRSILNELDTKNQCNRGADCALIDQDPFGATVPFPKNQLASMRSRMHEYCERCDDGFSNSVIDDDLINEPVCVDCKCMVSTSFKKESGN
jgi:hypothetical protein